MLLCVLGTVAHTRKYEEHVNYVTDFGGAGSHHMEKMFSGFPEIVL